MFIVQAQTEINAPPQIVYEVLTRLEDYHSWSTMLHYLGGRVALGQKLNLRLEAPGAPAYSFSPTVTRLEPARAFGWLAVTVVRGLFDGEHAFELEPTADGRTLLTNREAYRGLLSPIMRRLPMMKGAQAGFERMNEEIKARAESRAR